MLFKPKENSNELNEKKIVDHIRCLGIDMINEAKSGHPGIVLDAAPMLYSLYGKHMKINPNDATWLPRRLATPLSSAAMQAKPRSWKHRVFQRSLPRGR